MTNKAPCHAGMLVKHSLKTTNLVKGLYMILEVTVLDDFLEGACTDNILAEYTLLSSLGNKVVIHMTQKKFDYFFERVNPEEGCE